MTILFTLTLPALTQAQTQTPAQPPALANPAVLEIFTSKYCPACPAGDRNFNRLIDENPDLIALSCHVTYFNRGARKDGLSHAFCDARQSVYHQTLKTGGIFTPLMVENGHSFTTGIKEKDAQNLNERAKNNKNRLVGLRQNGEYLDIRLPPVPLDKNATLWLLEIEIHPRENGYTHYRNAIKNITKLLNWNGEKLNMAFPVTASDANTGYAVIAHNAQGKIIAAGKTGV
ncbi:MAG: DUF1223 domain-containing protein [Alphaproteobacteria bacterium]